MTTYAVTTANVAYRAAGFNTPTYDGGAAPANQGAIFDFYRGKGSAPLRGRPTLIHMVGGEYTSSTKVGTALDTTDANFLRQFCAWWADMGGSVMEAVGITVDNGAPHNKYVSNGKTTSGLPFPPGFIPSGAGFAPYGHVDCPNWYTDNIHLIQHVKWNALSYDCDPENVWVIGDSFSTHGFMWAMYKERALELGSAGQLSMSTRVRGAFLDRPGMVRCDAWETAMTVPISAKGSTLAGGDYTTPMATFADWPTAAQVGVEFRNVLSLLGTGGWGDPALIKGTHLFLSTGVSAPGDSTCTQPNIIDPPFAGLASVEENHSSWFNAVLRKYVTEAPCRSVAGTDDAYNSMPAAGKDGQYGVDGMTAGQRTTGLVAEWVDFAKKYAFRQPYLRSRADIRQSRRRRDRLTHRAFP